ncbi:UDP-Glycosyltransferase/glycogen phosphorylase [Armillaria solidipes]|uniref:UDP-Glycosyltransferase/glycogen phosphorylase n=1 Tax=Armillaria solidipes TaxID=1076256 RepID=A0A2H3B0E2_9AGAR|nr:UDP-Glycosyltransferase/glycogen phosphorylase [Armillaria solidipes]
MSTQSFVYLILVRDNVYVIPNALVPEHLQPGTPKSSDTVTIVVLSRLAYRKGIDLLVATAPHICSAFPNVRFVVGGDGPKLIDLLQMREKHNLQDRIELLGPTQPNDVRSAACAGLYVVSTRVGGVPEILPEDMISFAEPEEDDVFRAISEAIKIISDGKHDPIRAHERIKTFYDWAQVAECTEVVYDTVVKSRQMELWERMKRTTGLGPFAGPIYLIILVVDCLFFMFLEWWFPRGDMDFVVRHWDHDRFAQVGVPASVFLQAGAWDSEWRLKIWLEGVGSSAMMLG